MPKKINSPQEVSAASSLLRAWGMLGGGEHLPVAELDRVIDRYAKDRLYDFGGNLFEHLSMAATMKNQWSISGPMSAIGAIGELEKFLYKTTTASRKMDIKELRAEFEEIANRIKKNYKKTIKYRSEVMPMKNISEARRTEATLWAEAESKKKRIS